MSVFFGSSQLLLSCPKIESLFFFKLTHALVNVDSSVLPEVRKYGRRTRSSTSNVNKYLTKTCKTTTYQKSFLIRTSRFGIVQRMNQIGGHRHQVPLNRLISFVISLRQLFPMTVKTHVRSRLSDVFKMYSVRPLSCPITCCMQLQFFLYRCVFLF